jgi:diguanylate cyclase (GGDEF)-like protein/PAS domain S-box-containing protein
MSRRRIILIQDDPADAKTIRESLNETFQVEWMRTSCDGLKRLRRERHRVKQEGGAIGVILLDLFLSDSRGIATFDQIFSVVPEIPIVILSAVEHEDIAKLAVQHGAHDYLLKSRLDRYWFPKTLASVVDRAANTEALFEETERAQIMLNSIGDGVMSTDVHGNVTYLNTVAESLTGWTCKEATGRPLEDVFRIIDGTTREAMHNPMGLATRENSTMELSPNCILIRRDGVEASIEDSTAPIHDRRGQVTGAVMVFHDVSTERALLLRMSYLAQHDCLTDLPNRILFSDRLTEAIAMAQRYRRSLAVLYMDVDRFKHVNDSLGHDIGDRLLQSMAARLDQCVRSSDTVSRQGGDEFVILLSEIRHVQDAAFIAQKILTALKTPHRIDQHDLHLTVSIGIASFPDDGQEAEVLMKNADLAMYHAKDNGRNNYQFFQSDMNVRALERQSLETGLRNALERGEFVLYYQPKVNLLTDAIVGVEALIRWHHPQRGLIPPAQFIPVAEECCLIVPIGRWVMLEACRQARAWQDAGLMPLRIAINISAVELRDKDFVANVRSILTETGLEPQRVELELTETFLLQDSKYTSVVLEAIKDLGVGLALDDFGTGYSSLSHLKRYPIDTLKVDRAFVRDITTDADDASIVGAVIGMGKTLLMRVVAEGVETEEQLEFLKRQGCPEAQGYYFSHPVPAGTFTQLLANKMAGSRTQPDGRTLNLTPVT